MFFFDRIVGYIAPHTCIGCQAEGAVLCTLCMTSAGSPPPPRCVGCKVLSDGYKTCNSCRSWIDMYAVYVATEYSGVYEQLLAAYKFRFQRQAAESIAQIMLDIPSARFPLNSLLIPMPTAPSRVRNRGFDHTKLIAKIWLRRLNPTVKKQIQVLCALKRTSNNRQVGSTREERIQQVRSEFFVDDPSTVIGRSCIVLDDVTTTGASLAAAAKALKSAGAARVYGIVFAQKI